MYPRTSLVTYMVISFILHNIIAGSVLLWGWCNPFMPPAMALPVDFEVMPSVVADKGDTNLADAPPSRARPQETPKTHEQIAGASSPVAPVAEQMEPLLVAQSDTTPVTTPALVAETGGQKQKLEQTSITAPVTANNAGNGTDRPSNSMADGGEYTAAGVKFGARPAYPPQARREGRCGTVTLRILVDISGLPADVAVKDGSGHAALDEAAVQAVKKWRFYPAKKGGQAIASYHDVRVRFRLEDTR